jgi:7,8-dihydroneopterin aldolase/epimerase/oxygenase
VALRAFGERRLEARLHAAHGGLDYEDEEEDEDEAMRDAILIEALELEAHIGVPDDERAQTQRLAVSLRIEPQRGFGTLEDDLANAVDYFTVLNAFEVAAVEVELRKFILPDTAFVAVRLRRER